MRSFGQAPSATEIEALARAALARLPQHFADLLHDLVIQVEDFADDEVLDDLGIEGAYDLSGLYQGLPLTEKSIEHSGEMPDRVFLYRIPILLEWCERGDEMLEHLVAHVLVHEIGHHFGLSDEAMHALEEEAM